MPVENPHGVDPDLIAFAGDWHGDTPWAKKAIYTAAESGCQAIVHAGDFGFKFNRSFMSGVRHALLDTGLHLYFVRGNHDEPFQLDHEWPKDEFGFGQPKYGGEGSWLLHYIPQGHRWIWWDKIFMGLGGAHSVDRPWRTPMVDWWPEELISTADMYKAMDGGKVNVMITHDIPAKAKLPNDRKSFGWPEAELVESERHRLLLQSVVDEVQPDLLVHGHFHVRFSQQVGGMHVVGLDMNQSALYKNLYLVDQYLENRPLVERKPPASDKLAELRAKFIMDKAQELKDETDAHLGRSGS